MAGLVSSLPFALSGRTDTATAATYALDGVAYQVAIGGRPFLLGVDQDHPILRGLAEIRKQQFDAQKEPGEQSLSQWWLRSQTTFLGGEGMLYQDPDLVASANLRNRHEIQFGHSVGVDVWTDGQATLLRKTNQRTTTGTYTLGYNDGTDRLWIADGTSLSSDDGTTTTAITWGGTGTIVSLTSDGTSYYAADNVGIWSAVGTAAGAKAWNTGSSNVVIGWVKGRLMAGIDNKVYELQGGTPPTLPSPKFTHLNASWKWTAIAEGTDSIYVAGHAGSQSAIYKFALDTSGNVPTLSSGGIITAAMPQGEVINCLVTYLGTYVGIGTNRGFRVGQIDSNGDIAYGPLLLPDGGAVNAVAAYDRFFFISGTTNIDGNSGLWRVDLGQPISDTSVTNSVVRFAYASDLQAHVTGTVTSVTVFGNSDRLAFCVSGHGTYLEDASQLESTGYLETGRVRFDTLEPKLFKFVSVKTPSALSGTVSVSVIDPGGGETSILTASEGGDVVINDVALSTPAMAVEWIQLKMTLGRSANDATKGGEINGWQIKAMPGAVRQRVITLPLLCFDREQDIHGQLVGYEGRALERLKDFEQLAQRGDGVSLQDLTNGETTMAVIDAYEYRQTAALGPNHGNYGGILTVQLRTIADVVTA